jgi:hypothetical protein
LNTKKLEWHLDDTSSPCLSQFRNKSHHSLTNDNQQAKRNQMEMLPSAGFGGLNCIEDLVLSELAV